MRAVFIATALVLTCLPAQKSAAQDQAQGTQPETREHDTETDDPEIAGPVDEGAPKPTGDEMKAKVEKALRRFDGEPRLPDLQAAALRFADADKESASGWLLAPNRSAILPVLKLVADRDIERDETLDRYQDEPDKWGADTDRDLGFQISAQWNLGELIFNPDEVRVYGALSDRASRREAILTVLIGYFFERRRLQLRTALAPPEDLAETAEILLRIEELTASIDALTGGFLSRTLNSTKGASKQ